MSIANRLRNFFRKPALDRDVDDEITFHIDTRRDEYIAQGVAPAEAAHRARKDFGRLTQIREETRSMNLPLWLETLAQDLRFGARQLRHNPTLALTSILTLALGMGATTAIFTIADAVLFRPLPYPDAGRLVTLHDRFPTGMASPTIPEFLDYQAANQSFEQMAFFDSRDYQITGSDEPQRVFSARVTAGFFPLLGARPALGRVFTEAEIAGGNSDAVVLSHDFWRRAFGSDPAVIGRRLDLNGLPGTVIGVLQEGFSIDYATVSFFEPVNLYVPYPMTPTYLSRSGPDSSRRRVQVIARLRPTASIESASANMATVTDRLLRDYPQLYRGSKGESLAFTALVRPLRVSLMGGDGVIANLLSGAVGFIFLLACANTVQARLAHGITRHREFAVRGAIGAGRGRLIRQLLAESLLLAAIAAAVGLLVAQWSLVLILKLIPATPYFKNVSLDARAFLVMGALLIVTTVLCGLLPAFSMSRAASPLMLRTSAAAEGIRLGRLRGLLITGQIALALVLLVSAGLLFRTLVSVQSAVGGFSPENVLTMQMRMRFQRTKGLAHASQAWQQIVERVAQAPGVAAAGVSTGLPPGGGEFPFFMAGSGQTNDSASRQMARSLFVSPGFFTALQVPLIAGRTFSEADTPDRPLVAVIGEQMARQFWPGENPIGRVIGTGQQYTIVGIVGDFRVRGFSEVPIPQVYLSYRTTTEPNMLMLVRSHGTADIFPAVREAVRAADPEQPVFNVRSMERLLYESVAGPRLLAVLSGIFAVLGISLVTTGLYGAISYLVARRIPEIAIRMALGAHRWDVLKLVSSRLLLWTTIGLALGIGASIAASSLLRDFLRGGIQPTDPLTFVGASVLFLAVIAVAAAIPLRRALTTDPAAALRAE